MLESLVFFIRAAGRPCGHPSCMGTNLSTDWHSYAHVGISRRPIDPKYGWNCLDGIRRIIGHALMNVVEIGWLPPINQPQRLPV